MSSNHEDMTAREKEEARTAYALGQLGGEERAAAEANWRGSRRSSWYRRRPHGRRTSGRLSTGAGARGVAIAPEAIQKEVSPKIEIMTEPLAAELERREAQGLGHWASAAIVATCLVLVPVSCTAPREDEQVVQSAHRRLRAVKPVGREVAGYGRTLPRANRTRREASQSSDGGRREGGDAPGISVPISGREMSGGVRPGLGGPGTTSVDRDCRCTARRPYQAGTQRVGPDGTLSGPSLRVMAGAGRTGRNEREEHLVVKPPGTEQYDRIVDNPFGRWPSNRSRPSRSTSIRPRTPTSAAS